MTLPTLTAPPAAPSFTGDSAAFVAACDAFMNWWVNTQYPEITAWSAALPATVNGIDYNATSTTSVTIGTGAKTFTVQSGKNFQVGQSLRIASTASPANYMDGYVTSYSGTTLNVTVTAIGGTGTIASWTISLAVASGGYLASSGGSLSGSLAITGGVSTTTDAAIGGKVLVGATTGYATAATNQIASKTTSAEGLSHFVLGNGANTNGYLYINGVNSIGYNAAGSCMYVGAHSVAGRSINAAGTVNASGADYAEYMVKAEGCAPLAKGDVVGIDGDGLLTDRFDAAHSFVIKSSDPAYVGGDSWAAHLGPRPQVDAEPIAPADPDPADVDAVAAYAEALAAWQEDHDAWAANNAGQLADLDDWTERFEAARATVDRVAFAGQVPVNVTGAAPGDWIVPERTADGGIAGRAVTDPSDAEWRAAIGKVWKVLPDGRAWVAVRAAG